MIKDIAHVALNPLDMDRSVAFFENVFGWKKSFELHHDNDDPWIVYMKICKGHFLELFYDVINDRDYAFDFKKTGYNHLCVTVGNIRKTLQEIHKKGYIDSPEPETEKSKCKNRWLYDPDGNGIELQEYTPECIQMQSNEAPYEFGQDGYVGIGHACFVCRDINASLDFYCTKLGMKLVGIQENDEGKPWIHYVRIADGVYLELLPDGQGENPNIGWNSRGFSHLCLESDSLLEDIERLRSIGVEIDQEPKTGSDLNWQAWIHDPDGNKIELMMIHPDSPQAKA
ncbi:MAG: VOC family protein [Bacteroidales bacterium]|nr:VOC family protein [Bacteroidales bacterium]